MIGIAGETTPPLPTSRRNMPTAPTLGSPAGTLDVPHNQPDNDAADSQRNHDRQRHALKRNTISLQSGESSFGTFGQLSHRRSGESESSSTQTILQGSITKFH